MEGLFYRARAYYQYSNIWEIYNALGGQFIQRKKNTFYLLQNQVGKENCYLWDKSRELPPGIHGLILEMSLNSVYYLERKNHFKNVLIYHGMGMDKNLKGRNFPVSRYDYYFVSGEKDYLKYKYYSRGLRSLKKRVVKIGLLRSDIIINKKYKREETIKKIGISDKSRKNILYAPTWSRGHGSLLETYEKFCLHIPTEHNLLIRTHPYDVDNYKIVNQFIEKNKITNVYLIDPTKIDPIDNLSVADLLIGENSSLMYDWIFFNRPVILVKTPVEELESARWAMQDKFRVYTCGYTYLPGEDNINDLISKSFDKHPFEEQLAFVRNSTFYYNDGKANERAIEWIKDQLAKMN